MINIVKYAGYYINADGKVCWLLLSYMTLLYHHNQKYISMPVITLTVMVQWHHMLQYQ